MTNPVAYHLPFQTTVIPESSQRYKVEIKETGIKILDLVEKKECLPDEKGIYCLVLYGKDFKVALDWIICFTYKPLYKAEKFAHKWKVGKKKDSEIFVHPSNLFWITEEGGTECPEKSGFYVVPGYTRHAIDASGQPYSRNKDRLQEIRSANPTKENSYINTSFTNDAGVVCTVGVHRMVCLAFFQITTNPERLTANHKNGIKKDNRLENLEVHTYRENNLHSYEMGLRVQGRQERTPVLVRNYHDMTETWYRSLSDAALVIGANVGVLTEYFNRNYGSMFKGQYKLRLASEKNIDWGDNLEFKKIVNPDLQIECASKNIFTGKIEIASSINDLANVIGESTTDIRRGLTRSFKVPIRGFIYTPANDLEALNVEYEEIEKEWFRNNPLSAKPIKITTSIPGNGNKEVKIFNSISESFEAYKDKIKHFYPYKEQFEKKMTGVFEMEGILFEFKKLWL